VRKDVLGIDARPRTPSGAEFLFQPRRVHVARPYLHRVEASMPISMKSGMYR